MERLGVIADAHYRAGPPEFKTLAYDFFKALDTDEDGLVSLPEFLALMKQEGHTRLANPHFFRELDRDGDGALDFWEVLTLYYIINSGRPLCECCGILVPGTYFSCVECFDSSLAPNYSLCMHCYRSGKSSHSHDGHQQFLDTYTLLENNKRTRSANQMERLRVIADAHYRAGPPEVKILAYDFFKALDTDEDGLVSLPEFLALMKQEGHTKLANPYFFRELDRDGNGFLDFWEVLTLYYIIKSGMPLCECCGVLVLDTYFSCVECFDCPDTSYSLCILCYRSNRSNHSHGGRQQFLDTFTLLETKRRRRSSHQIQATSPGEVVQQPSWGLVPVGGRSGWKAALKALEMGLSIGSISTTLCTIL